MCHDKSGRNIPSTLIDGLKNIILPISNEEKEKKLRKKQITLKSKKYAKNGQ